MLVREDTYPTSDELTFLRAYDGASLRRIEVVSDAILERIFLADGSHRALLGAQLLAELSEAAQRLLAVCTALRDISVPVSRTLLMPLPGANEWHRFAEAVFEAPPENLLRAMRLDRNALDSATELSSVTDLGRHAEVIRLHENGHPVTIIDTGESPLLQLLGHDRENNPCEFKIALSDHRVVGLGDATGHLVAMARDFLLTYVELQEAKQDVHPRT